MFERVHKTVLAPQAQCAIRAVDIPVATQTRPHDPGHSRNSADVVVDIPAVQRPSPHSADCIEHRGETSQVQHIDRIVDVLMRKRTPCSRDDATPGSHDPERVQNTTSSTSPYIDKDVDVFLAMRDKPVCTPHENMMNPSPRRASAARVENRGAAHFLLFITLPLSCCHAAFPCQNHVGVSCPAYTFRVVDEYVQ